MAFHLLERDREGAQGIVDSLGDALRKVIRCKRCNTFSEEEYCSICASKQRDSETLCVVETPADLESVEQSGVYQGMYFVLMGHLSPLDGIGPEELALDRLTELINRESISEVIIATNLTAEGEATAEYVHHLISDRQVKMTRIARGVPVGGELEYLDHGTLSQAFSDRRVI